MPVFVAKYKEKRLGMKNLAVVALGVMSSPPLLILLKISQKITTVTNANIGLKLVF